MRVGIAEIDGQHRRLLELGKELAEAKAAGKSPDELNRLRGGLVDQTLLHFATEEKLFAEYGYPEAAAHAAEHKRIALQLRQIHARMVGGADVPDEEVMKFQQEWVRDHIQGFDKKFGQWAVAHGLR